jgi:hypothetical protein
MFTATALVLKEIIWNITFFCCASSTATYKEQSFFVDTCLQADENHF